MAVIEIDLQARTVLSAVTAYTGQPIVDELVLRAGPGEQYSGVAVTLTCRSLGETVFGPHVITVNQLGAVPLIFDSSSLRGFRPTVEQLTAITEHRAGEIVVEISEGEVILAEHRSPIDLLPIDAWQFDSRFPNAGMIELASFVQPQSPVVAKIAQKASDILGERYGSTSLRGFVTSGGKDGLDQSVEAIYDAIKSFGIRYAEPPASWGIPGGQRIRSAQLILDDGFATCLDSSVLFASVCEQVGIYCTLFMVPGHAFVGYRRKVGHGEMQTEYLDLANDLDQLTIVPVETTLITGSPELGFQAAVAQGTVKLEEVLRLAEKGDSETDVDSQGRRKVTTGDYLAIDVYQARINGVKALPVRAITPDGESTVIEYVPPVLTATDLRDSLVGDPNSTANLSLISAPTRVRTWLDNLLDLTLRNPLLNFRFSRASSLRLLVPGGFMGAVEDMLHAGKQVRLAPTLLRGEKGEPIVFTGRTALSDQVRDQLATMLGGSNLLTTDSLSDQELVTRMRRLATRARSAFEESGSSILYLAMGFVGWKPQHRNDIILAPLILVPVSIVAKNRSREFYLELDESGEITPNYSLAEVLKREYNLDLPQLLAPPEDEFGIDIPALVSSIRDVIAEKNLAGFRVDEEVALGLFDFSSFRMWKDLKENWSAFAEAPLVKHLIETPTEEFQQAEVEEDSSQPLDDFAATLPVPSDGSQALAVRDAILGKTFVLQGPPGTGKSQTITNLLARALHSGKRVLFVAEKPGALSVVRDRLAKVGLGAFGLNLHDKGMRPADVRAQLLAALDHEAIADRIGYDSAQSEIDRTISPLMRYPERLHAIGEHGESAYSARNHLLALGDGPELEVTGAFLSSNPRESVDHVRSVLRQLADQGPAAGIAAVNPWSFSTAGDEALSAESKLRIGQLVAAIDQTWKTVVADSAAIALLNSCDSASALTELAVLETLEIDLDAVDRANTADRNQARAYVMSGLDAYEPGTVYAGASPSSLAAPVGELRAALATARTSFFIGRGKRVAAVCARISGYVASGFAVDAANADTVLTNLEQLQTAATGFTTYLGASAGLVVAPDFNVLDSELRVSLRQQVSALAAAIDFAGNDGTDSHAARRQYSQTSSALSRVPLGSLARQLHELFGFLAADEAAFDDWRAGRELAVVLQTAIPAWHDDALNHSLLRLGRWVKVWEILGDLQQRGLSSAVAQILSGQVSYPDAEVAFNRGFFRALERRQFDAQTLDAFDGSQHDAYVRAYGRAAHKLRELSPGILASDLVANRGFGTGVNMGAVGELRRELSKSRGGKQIRKLLHDHWHVISQLTPLVLAVPDALVRFLPADLEKFDLVVFDEASQIKVPHAIGALGRGRSAVVVGDSKQMPPTSIAQGSGANDDDAPEGYVADEESILTEAVQARVPETYLRWHYRSEDESLIALSNVNFYDGKLRSLPSPGRSKEHRALQFRQVDGKFKSRGGQFGTLAGTNQEEADAIVAEIQCRLADPVERKKSIGVITFNKPQQSLIVDMLNALEDEHVRDALEREEEKLAVWNLETVQGHERDVILFSIAFSKNEKGVIGRNWGPVTVSGGEKRINVAISRARQQVVVFCSFDPQELSLDGMNEKGGLARVKEYLMLAKFGPDAIPAFNTQTGTEAPDRHRDEIVEAFQARGNTAKAGVGLSGFKVDVAVGVPGEDNWKVGILLDGHAWKERPTAGDRDSLPLELLENRMGWPAVERIWLPDWVRDPSGQVDRIAQVLAEVQSRPVPERASQHVAEERSSVIDGRSAGGDAPIASPSAAPIASTVTVEEPLKQWAPWSINNVGPDWMLDQLYETETRTRVINLAKRIVAFEGPLPLERLAKLIAGSFQMQRVANKRVVEIGKTIASDFEFTPESFVFAKTDPASTYAGWAGSLTGARGIDQISLEEIGNAMKYVAKRGFGISRDEVSRETINLFGIKRLTPAISERVDDALAKAIKLGVLVEKNGYLVAGE